MTWRYQPVILNDGQEDYIVLLECHFNADGRLTAWESRDREAGRTYITRHYDEDERVHSSEPYGEDVAELQRVLKRMLLASYTWAPVRYADLRAGMTFEKLQDQHGWSEALQGLFDSK